MTSRDFCYWLQGYFEISHPSNRELSAAQADMIRNHLALVFKHEIDPSIAKPGTPEATALDAIHDSFKPKPGHSGPFPGPTYRC